MGLKGPSAVLLGLAACLFGQAQNEIVNFGRKQQREEDQKCFVTLAHPVDRDTQLLLVLRGKRSKEVTIKAGESYLQFRLPEYDKVETVSIRGAK